MNAPDALKKRGMIFNQVLESAVRLLIIALLLLWCFQILRPFVTVVMWGVIIAVALHPLYERLRGLLGGRTKLASIIFTVVILGLIVVPTFNLAESLVDTGAKLADVVTNERELQVPHGALR